LIPGRLLKRNGADEALNQPLGRKTRGDGEVLDSRQKNEVRQGETQGSNELPPVETSEERSELGQRTKTSRSGHLRMVTVRR
jgi:hypothetical protein